MTILYAEKITTEIYVKLIVARHLLKRSTENKNKSLCQVGTLWQSQEFMPQVARGFVYYVFMFIKLIFIQKYYLHWTFHLC